MNELPIRFLPITETSDVRQQLLYCAMRLDPMIGGTGWGHGCLTFYDWSKLSKVRHPHWIGFYVYTGDQLIGFVELDLLDRFWSRMARVEENTHWGITAYLLPSYRGKRFSKQGWELLSQYFPNMVWFAKADNVASCVSAERVGLTLTHPIYEQDGNFYLGRRTNSAIVHVYKRKGA